MDHFVSSSQGLWLLNILHCSQKVVQPSYVQDAHDTYVIYTLFIPQNLWLGEEPPRSQEPDAGLVDDLVH
jgi:hypothetical protein